MATPAPAAVSSEGSDGKENANSSSAKLAAEEKAIPEQSASVQAEEHAAAVAEYEKAKAKAEVKVDEQFISQFAATTGWK